MTVNIYGLIDSRTGVVRYVGRTIKAIDRRLADHVSQAKSNFARGVESHVQRWILKMIAGGFTPTSVLLEIVEPGASWSEAERCWIRHFRSVGVDLTNRTDGGDGVPGLFRSQETRDKIALAQRGKPRPYARRAQTPEDRAKKSAAAIARYQRPLEREKTAASKLGRKQSVPWSEERRQRARNQMLARYQCPGERERTSERLRGRVVSEETRKKISSAKRRQNTEASCAA